MFPVGAGLPAMVVNDNACLPGKRGVLESIAGKPAPSKSGLVPTGENLSCQILIRDSLISGS
ncbi:hypothetical protein DBR45_54545 [Pseudomonas sp. HMWF031]|nr:hypothetical protein DBR45_54545 [Pseudomonas sp. HMWF031]